MSMREYPNSGYVVPAECLTAVLPDDLRASYTAALSEQLEEAVSDWLGEHWPSEEQGFPPVAGVYDPKAEDTIDGETIRRGKLYVLFDQPDLFVSQPRRGSETLRAVGIEPVFSRWSVWG